LLLLLAGIMSGGCADFTTRVDRVGPVRHALPVDVPINIQNSAPDHGTLVGQIEVHIREFSEDGGTRRAHDELRRLAREIGADVIVIDRKTVQQSAPGLQLHFWVTAYAIR
jgi:hypothetical protein